MSKLNEVLKQQKELLNKDEEDNIIDDYVQVVGFIVGDEEFAVPILSIQEIIKPIEWTRVPFTPPYVLGVFNLRGNVLPLIDLRIKFNTATEPEIDPDTTRFIVMKIKEENVAFIIDKLTSALRIPKKNITPPPSTYENEDDLIEGIGRMDDGRIITILKVDNLIKREEIVGNNS
jgi:purine-binding chemotaxis protein CheW